MGPTLEKRKGKISLYLYLTPSLTYRWTRQKRKEKLYSLLPLCVSLSLTSGSGQHPTAVASFRLAGVVCSRSDRALPDLFSSRINQTEAREIDGSLIVFPNSGGLRSLPDLECHGAPSSFPVSSRTSPHERRPLPPLELTIAHPHSHRTVSDQLSLVRLHARSLAGPL